GDGVEILREALPTPLDAFGERGAGNVLHALHEPDQPVVPIRPGGREADTAVAHDDRRDPVPRRWREVGVPRHLPIVVRVDVDPPGGDEEPGRIDLAAAPPGATADVRDAIAVDGDVPFGA